MGFDLRCSKALLRESFSRYIGSAFPYPFLYPLSLIPHPFPSLASSNTLRAIVPQTLRRQGRTCRCASEVRRKTGKTATSSPGETYQLTAPQTQQGDIPRLSRRLSQRFLFVVIPSHPLVWNGHFTEARFFTV